MATVAVVAGAAATVAAKGYEMSQAKGASGPDRSVLRQSLGDRLFNHGTRDILNRESNMMGDALAQGSFMEPELYKLLGYEPVYESTGADLSAAGAKADALNQRLSDIQNEFVGSKGKKRAKLKKERARVQRQVQVAQKDLLNAQTNSRRVVGVRPLDPGTTPDPTGLGGNAMQVALQLENETLIRALKGDEPIDATLKTNFEERERDLRDRLRKSLGTDYEDSTAGANALANFSREKAEAFQQFNTETVKNFNAMTQERASTLSNLTSARMGQLLGPANAKIGLAQALGGSTQARNDYAASSRAERQLQYGGEVDATNFENQQNAQQTQAISGMLSGVGGGLMSLGGSGYLGAISGPSAGTNSGLGATLSGLQKYVPGTSAYNYRAAGLNPATPGILNRGGAVLT